MKIGESRSFISLSMSYSITRIPMIIYSYIPFVIKRINLKQNPKYLYQEKMGSPKTILDE